LTRNVVSLRSLGNFIVVGLSISLSGVLLDLDHVIVLFVRGANARWFHFMALRNPLVFLLYSVCWGSIISALVFGWILWSAHNMSDTLEFELKHMANIALENLNTLNISKTRLQYWKGYLFAVRALAKYYDIYIKGVTDNEPTLP